MIAIKYIENWYMLPIDKIFGGRNILYRFKNGCLIECRTKSTDINEALVVLSGIEYPYDDCKVQDGAVVFDVGANIGTFSCYIKRINEGREFTIHSFEPSRKNLEIMRNNLNLNTIKSVHLHESAVYSHTGQVSFDTTGDFDGFAICDDKDCQMVNCITLTDFCHKENITVIDLLKMDVEGAEFEIITKDTAIFSIVRTLFLEFHYDIDSENFKKIHDLLSPYFFISTENVHNKKDETGKNIGGGMIIAKNKYIK